MCRFLLLAALAVGALSACGRTAPVGAHCETLTCPEGTTCDGPTGRCVLPSSRIDGGTTDGGQRDGGALDGGGETGDGGTDGGQRDGGVTDGGHVPCPNGCPGTQFCDPEANEGKGLCITCTPTKGCGPSQPICDTQVPGGVCVECLTSSQCGAARPVCNPASRTCVGCLNSSSCQNPTPVCSAFSHECGPCTSTAQCPSGAWCSFGNCLPLPDTCATAQLIDFMGGTTVSFNADTSLAQNDYQGTCNASGRELVYRLSLPAARDVTITATRGPTGIANPVIYLRGAPCANGASIACANAAPTAGGTETIAVPNLPAGDYFLFVEGVQNQVGPTTVTVSAVPPVVAPSNDTCANAQTLFLSSGHTMVQGTTVGATNGNPPGASSPSCSTSARQVGPDVVYQFTLPQARDVAVKVTSLDPTGTFRPAVYLRGQGTASCNIDSQLACEAQPVTGPIAPQTLLLPNLPAGTYFIWVDGVLGTSGQFVLDVTASAPTTNDNCGSPKALLFQNGVATATGDTRFAQNNQQSWHASPTCSTSARNDGRDVVFSYNVPTTSNVTITVTPTGASPTFQPVLYVHAPNACGQTGTATELACVSNTSSAPVTLNLANQAPGTYFLWVDGSQQTAGPFQLEVTLQAGMPTTGDTCPGTPLVFINGQAQVSASLTAATNSNFAGDAVPTCSVNARSAGRDLIYSYTLSQTRDVNINVIPSGGAFTPVLYVKRGACSSNAVGDELACVTGSGFSGGASYTLHSQPPGVYWIYVDSDGTGAGSFSLNVQQSSPTPPPPNDTCTGAQLLSFVNDVAQVSGNTTFASNGNTASDASPTCSPTAKQKGRDVVYRYALLTSPRDVTVTVTPQGPGGYVPVVYVRGQGVSTCASISAGSELGCAQASSPGPVSFTLQNQPVGTYSIHVDGAFDTWGPFGLTVTLSAPTVLPETCAQATALTLGVPFAGSNTAAQDNYSRTSNPAYGPLCTSTNSYPWTGRDLVYEFTASGTTHTATLTPSAQFDGALLFLQPPTGLSCSPQHCTTFSDNLGAGAAETLVLTNLAPGQKYYLVVDNWSGNAGFSSGNFTLVVQ